MAGLFPPQKETDAAQAMHACLDSRPPAHFGLDFAYGPETRRMKQAGRPEQYGVKNLRRARDAGEPFQPANDEAENQVSSLSIGARSATAGPFNTLPSASKRDP